RHREHRRLAPDLVEHAAPCRRRRGCSNLAGLRAGGRDVMNLLLVILAHADRRSLQSLIENARAFCPGARLMLYNSGPDPDLGKGLDVEQFAEPRIQEYARITPFFLEVFEWAVRSGDAFDAIVNLETDMLFVRS